MIGTLAPDDRGDCLCGNPFAAPGWPESLGCGGLDAHYADVNAEQVGQAAAHRLAVGAHAGSLADYRDIDVADRMAGFVDKFDGMGEEPV